VNDSLDPDDWAALEALLAGFAAEELKALRDSLSGPVWREPPASLRRQLSEEPLPVEGEDLRSVIGRYREQIRPWRNGNTHPRFFGWVQGGGNLASVFADVAASLLNPNVGGREHGAVHVEREVIRWCRELFGFPGTASGILTTGTSAGTHLAIQLAAFRHLGLEHKRRGFFDAGPPLRCYCSAEGHSSIIKAIEACGIGSDHLVVIPVDERHRIRIDRLQAAINEDRAAGLRPFLVIANAGTVNTGAFDDLPSIRRLCDREGCWMHVDGAFGAWLALAEAPWRSLTEGIGAADSLAFDFHKLISVSYECGGLLVRDGDFHQRLYSIRPDYLAPHGEALAGGEPWFCDFGLELSRSFRALKVWFTFRHYGIERLGRSVTRACGLARHLAGRIEASPVLELCREPISTIVTFRLSDGSDTATHNRRIARLSAALQRSGEAVFSLTREGETRVLRASLTNHRTTEGDIDRSVASLESLIAP
jgi:glutamate/tyrosine decarboxylase-like PLP-dependent enzyme